MDTRCDRREFLMAGSAAGAGLLMSGNSPAAAPEAGAREAANPAPINLVRIGFVGIGNRGSYLVDVLSKLQGVEIRALCDIVPDRVATTQQKLMDAGHVRPEGYTQGERDYEHMCERNDLDLVINAAPWKWHVPISVAAMSAGKHAFTEVPAATTVDGCWELVETSERTGRHCVIMENCCYFRNAMMVLNMIRKGLLGEMLHCEAGYEHYSLGGTVFDDKGNLLWRGEEMTRRNGNLYPTHAVGPNRGDRFDYLVSMSCKSRGLRLYAEEHFGAGHPLATQDYALGDVNTTLIRTQRGLTITLYYDTQSPRPYDLIYRAQGTKGIYSGSLDKIYVQGRTQGDTWESTEGYAEYEHPLWKTLGEDAKGQGHGGADYIMLNRLIRCLQTGAYPDIDVYDAADWSVISELSERSVSRKSRPVEFPDFTRGRWKTRTPLGIVEG
jgi:hypothetical protein